MADLGALTPVALLTALWWLGLARPRSAPGTRALGRARRWAGGAGIVALGLALGPPVDVWATTHLAAHMVQHVVLLAVAPPLLVFGTVFEIALDGFTTTTGLRVERITATGALTLDRVPIVLLTAFAVALQTAALGFWHIPSVYDAALAHIELHALEHLSFLVTGLAFWWIVAGAGKRAGTGAAVITIFLASLPGTLLGALMTLSTKPWYPGYATGSAAHALQDQQLAGVVMWAGGGMAYVTAGAVLFVTWLREMERTTPARARPELAP